MKELASEPTDAVDERPLLRVVRGAPDDVELAAVATVLAALATAPDTEPEPSAPASRWSDRTRALRRPLAVGPDAWRTSAWPS